MAKEIILVRHGQIDHNIQGRYCGWTNPSLNQKGINQAMKIKDKLADEKIDAIYTSDLSRCMETAEIINKGHNINISTDVRLREINFGCFEDLSYEEISDKYPDHRDEWIKDGMNYIMPSGESVYQLIDRSKKAVEEIVARDHDRILIVTHSGVIRGLLSSLISNNSDSYWRYKIDNCGICRIEVLDDFYILKTLNK